MGHTFDIQTKFQSSSGTYITNKKPFTRLLTVFETLLIRKRWRKVSATDVYR